MVSALMLSLMCVSVLPANGGGKKVTFSGQVFDSACLFTKDLKDPIGNTCALECAAGGSPLVIMSKEGEVYLPVDSDFPAKGQNYRLVKFAGKMVKLTGDVYEKKAAKAIVISTIEEVEKSANQ